MSISPRTDRLRPSLELLEARDVPAVLDLTAAGASGAVNEALFQQTNARPTGTGAISSFVRVQGTGVERGYNTDARPLQLNENSSPRFTRSLRLSDVPVVVVDNVAYRQFLLDINQKSSAPLLSLDELQIFLGDRGDLTGYDAGADKLAGRGAVYNLDGAGDSAVLMNYSLNSGSGSGDAFVLVPDRVFASPVADPNVYLYSAFGQTAAANSGFEEWAVLPKTDVTGLGSLAGKVYFDADGDGGFGPGDAGISGVFVTLTGVDDRGNSVHTTAVTGSDGTYRFVNLRPGTYTLTETQPAEYEDGTESAGSLGGSVGGGAGDDFIAGILLMAGQHGTGYDFRERLISQPQS